MNDFSECLAMSHAASDLPFWEECYRSAFPTMMTFLDHRQDGDHQRQGVDRSIILQNHKQILIDEKVRFRNRITGKIYTDILLEEISDRDRHTPGWVVKPLLCDYIAYAIAPLGKCYLLPVIQLQTAWLQHGSLWKHQAGRPCQSLNKFRGNSWVTVNWPVKPDILFKAIGQCLRIQFTPYDPDNNTSHNGHNRQPELLNHLDALRA